MVDFYSIANSMNKGGGEQINFKDKEKLGLNQTDVKSNYTRIALTIGNAMVVKNGNMYKITDTYDFNNYAQNPEKYTPYSADWIITKNGNRAIIHPLIAVEEGDTKTDHSGQNDFHRSCFLCNYNPDIHI
jgi:hypothetical protein